MDRHNHAYRRRREPSEGVDVGKGRFQTFPFMSRGFPPVARGRLIDDPPCDGEGGEERRIDLCDFVQGKSACLVFGTGPKSAPIEMFEIAQRHLDITFGEYSVETCTAFGAVVAVLAHELKRFAEEKR